MAESFGPEIACRKTTDSPTHENMGQMEDCDLVLCAQKGQQEAFGVLVTRYSPIIIGFLYGKLRDRGDSEDLAQEVFLTAYRCLGHLRDSRQFGPWLRKICKSRLVDFCRLRARRPQLVGTTWEADGKEPGPLDRAPDQAPSPADQAIWSETQGLVMQEIGRLKEKYGEVLWLQLIGNATPGEIAKHLRLKEETVRVRLHRAMRQLRKALERRGIRPQGAETGK